MTQELKQFIKENRNLINEQKWEELFKKSGVDTLELIQVLKSLDIHSLNIYLKEDKKDSYFWKNIIGSFLKITENLTTGEAGNNPTVYDEFGFFLKSQVSYFSFEFDPDTAEWCINEDLEVIMNQEEHLFAEGKGWDNFIHNAYEHDMGWFRGTDWNPKDYFIGDKDKYPLTLIDIEWEEVNND